MAQSMSVILLLLAVSRLVSTVGPTDLLLHVGADTWARLSLDPADTRAAAADFGRLSSRPEPAAVLRPGSAADVARLLRSAFDSAPARPAPVSARGHGHSAHGQALAPGGVVVDMAHRSASTAPPGPAFDPGLGGHYVDVWAGELWVDVLNRTLEHGGLAPKSWTDYLYLSVGGTLSNAGISGQAFRHGPQISNVYDLDVVTGKGEIVTCSEKQNAELFHAVLGGLGQFGIITRARIALERAPKRVRWIRVLYSNFTAFTRDQEHLISLHAAAASGRFDYVEGFVIVDEGLINNWRSSFFSPRNPVKITSLAGSNGVLYCLEVTKNYDESTAGSVDQEVEALLKQLEFVPGTVFTTDVPYVDFLDRVHKAELKLRAKGLWDVPHPWLNLFVPASRIADFDRGVFRGILGANKTSGPILIYPMNKHKWDERSSAVTPDEDVFYLVAFLRSALPDSGEPTQSLEHLTRQNQQILDFCDESGIGAKQYLPHHKTRAEWARHFGSQWETFLRRKSEFDPKFILGSGQGIFQPVPSTSSSHLFPS
ncbi:Cytokinin dehydrogenase 5 [Ananas comosus]|uniref:cytokinin dehydrogenase n=1 Tax=Ananas comosus TaxID=4615 RepID=A0A199UNV3_ANACO|nr:Cytokinin dehydrogenase 5 [Ananas comosus]